VNDPTERPARDTAGDRPPAPGPDEPLAFADLADSDLLAATELRTLTPEALQLLAATGC